MMLGDPTTTGRSRETRADTHLAAATAILEGNSKQNALARILPFLGPAFVASIAYVDPGNFATNIQAGAELGYTLLWVVTASNLLAILIQALSAKLGIATGLNLAELCRIHFSKPWVLGMWVLMELVAMATDLAEFLGAALGFYLLFGIPMLPAGILTAIVTFIILGLERFGFRALEKVITALGGIVAVGYLIEMALVQPDWRPVIRNAFVPTMPGKEGVLLAAGILGATVMPHAIFLHSALMQGRIVTGDPVKKRLLFRYEMVDVLVAMGLAGLINAAMLIMAASTFHDRGIAAVDTLEQAHRTLSPLLGPAAGAVFGIALLASGLSSASVGTMAGQVIMQGFLLRRIPVWLRRLITILPSLAIIASGFDTTRSMVISQVVLSFGLPFALVPLIYFTNNGKIMGTLKNRRITTLATILAAALIIALNVYLIFRTFLAG